MRNLKKWLAILLAGVLCVSCLCGCKVVNLETVNQSIEDLRDEIRDREQMSPQVIIQNVFPTTAPGDEAAPEDQPAQNDSENGDSAAEQATAGNSGNVTYITNNEQRYTNTTYYSETTIINQAAVTEERSGTDKDNNGTLGIFVSDEVYFVAGLDCEVVFTVEASNTASNIELCQSESSAKVKMRDDGLGGDAYADDGIYTAVQTVNWPAGSVEYWAQSGTTASNHTTLYFFERPTEETAANAEAAVLSVRENLHSIEERLATNGGYVPREAVDDVMEEIRDYLEGAKAAGDVLHYEIDGNSVFIKMPSGLALAYEPREEGADSVGSDVSMTVITCQPCFTSMGGSSATTSAYTLPDGVNYFLEMIDDVARDIDLTFDNYTFSPNNNLDDSQVTLARIRNISSNEIVLWHGHGYYGPVVKSCLVTGEAFDWNAYLWDVGYYADCVTNRIINSVLTGYDSVIISSGYIQKYCGNMDNSFIYLAACCSGKHAGLANAFLNKGAEAVVGLSETVKRTYNVRMLYETVENMLLIKEDTENYYTLKQAIQKAKRDFGTNDADTRYGGIGATPLIFGGSNAENYRFADVETDPVGTLTGQICRASDRSTPVPDANILVLQNGTLVESTNADSNGSYFLELPAGAYRLDISASGYVPFRCYVLVEEDRNTYVETFLMVEGEEDAEGTASGRVLNALTGNGVDGVELTVRRGWNNRDTGDILTTVYTNASGAYSVTLPLGNYTITAAKEGFITGIFNVVVQEGTTLDQNGSISPIISGTDYRIVLTWGLNPRDLDSHVVGPMSNGSSYHVYYAHKSQKENGVELCNLDVDDVTSYGPETITLTTEFGEPVYYYIHLYAGSGTLGASGAQVRVYQGDAQVAVFNVPTNLGSGRYWNVFAIKNGELTIRNTITGSPETAYAGAATARVPSVSNANTSGFDGVVEMDAAMAQTEDVTVEEEMPVPDVDVDSPITESDEEASEIEWAPELTEAYESLLAEWIDAAEALEEVWTFEELSDFDEFEERYPNVELGVLLDGDWTADGMIYAFCDVNGDEIPELLIGMAEAEDEDLPAEADFPEAEEATEASARIAAVYAIDDEEEIVRLLATHSIDQSEIILSDEGEIWWISETAGEIIQYKLAEDGMSVEAEKNYKLSSADDDADPENDVEYISEEDWDRILSDISPLDLSWDTMEINNGSAQR